MAATPGSGGLGGSAGAMAYRDKTVKAHDKFWPEVDKIEPILTDLKSKLHELSQSHLTVYARARTVKINNYKLVHNVKKLAPNAKPCQCDISAIRIATAALNAAYRD